MKTCTLGVLLAVSLSGAEKKPVTLEDVWSRKPSHDVSPVWAPDDRRFAYVQEKELMVFDIATKKKLSVTPMEKLTDAAAEVAEPEAFDWTNRRVSESPVQWFEDGKRLLVAEGGDLFVVSLEHAGDGKASFEQLTDTPVTESDPKLSPDNKYVSFHRDRDLYVMELASKKVTRLTHDGSDTLLNGQLDWVYPEELDLGTAHWWSPDSKHIAFLQLDIHAEPIFPQVSLLKQHGVLEPERYPKAGDPNAEARVGVVDVNGGAVKWMDLGEPRGFLLARVTWVPDSSAVAVMRLNRIQNRLDLLRADVRTGQAQTLIHEEDRFWINVVDEPSFLKTGDFIWQSERDGFRHFYLYGSDGRLKRQITKGEWVDEHLVRFDEEAGQLYFISTEASPLERHLYKAGLDGGDRRRLTESDGVHSVSLSPHGVYFTDSFSNIATPSSQTLRKTTGGEVMVWRQADRTAQETLTLSTPEIVKLPASDGETLYAHLIKPVPFDPSKKYPVIVQVYGGPGLQAVFDTWSGVSMEQLYASNGYVVWQLDNRGSANRGHKFESVLFRDMGQHELEDQLKGIEYLKKQSFVDAGRIGITGWSYGGFMTLYSLLNAPDVFRAGVAGAPVTDWHNYDSIYTERYMGLPEINKDGYDHSSDVKKAKELKAKLLIVHNIEDDNVHFANTIQMAQALEAANVQFRMLVFPGKSHGVVGPESHNLSATMLEFFRENLK